MVFTLSTGDPPKVAAQGQGLDATAAVGKRTVDWDGTSLVIE